MNTQEIVMRWLNDGNMKNTKLFYVEILRDFQKHLESHMTDPEETIAEIESVIYVAENYL